MNKLLTRRPGRTAGIAALLLAVGLTGCSENMAPQDEAERDGGAGPLRDRQAEAGGLFGEDGLSMSALRDGSLLGGEQGGDALPVNKYLWQGALDTLSFLPLESTDPFTGVIASDWSATPQAPSERFKVTVYMLRPALEASSVKVAVFREERNDEGLWVAQPVSPETPAKLETAILTRARQLRIAAIEGGEAG